MLCVAHYSHFPRTFTIIPVDMPPELAILAVIITDQVESRVARRLQGWNGHVLHALRLSSGG